MEIRDLIHRQIDAIQDEGTLQLVEDVLLNLVGPDQPDLPDHVIRGVEAGLADVRAGRFISDQEANAIVDKWLAE